MAAPNYVPSKPGQSKYYESPPRRGDSWLATRPGEIPAGMPEGGGFGWQGPDQGYALKLVGQFRDQVQLADGEHWDDVAAAAVMVALKRASIFGRAPVKYDLEIAFRIWGFLDPSPDPDLVALRRRVLAGLANPHHYQAARRVTDAVLEEALRKTPELVERQYERAWDVQIAVDSLAPTPDHDLDDD